MPTAASAPWLLDTSGDLRITQGEPSLVITAPASVLERLTSEVRNGELTLGVKAGTPGFVMSRISYELTLPSLEGLQINGSGDVESDVSGDELALEINGSGEITVTAIDASEVSLQVSGSGDAELQGRADELTISVDGSADVDSEELDSARVRVDISGSGDIAVAASEALDVSISGSASVRYSGNPEVTQDVAGSGEVERD